MVEVGSYWYNTHDGGVYRILREFKGSNYALRGSEIIVKNILTGEEKTLYSEALYQEHFVELSKQEVIKWKLKNG